MTTLPLPPPKVLWSKMLKTCSRADLDLLRCDVLIQIANEGFRVTDDPNLERVEFLRKIKLETGRRKRGPAALRSAVHENAAA